MTTPTLAVTIPGPVVPWQRTATHGGRRLTPERQRAYQRHVRACVSATLLGMKWIRSSRFRVSIFYTSHDQRRRDIDNVAKTILDACNGIAWDDDSQIDRLLVERVAGQDPGIVLVIMGDE